MALVLKRVKPSKFEIEQSRFEGAITVDSGLVVVQLMNWRAGLEASDTYVYWCDVLTKTVTSSS